MSRIRFWVALGAIGAGCFVIPVAQSQLTAGKGKPSPKLEPVAETKLLMEGIANPNMRGLGRILADKPKDAEAWGFARGQALLIAEAGNLLLMRPPRTKASEEPWMSHATDLREAAAVLARAAAAADYPKSRAALASVANVCNRCHQTFRVPTRIDPFGGE